MTTETERYSPDWLRALRDHIGITQAQAAVRLGVGVSTWANWEQGKTKPLPAFRAGLDRMARARGFGA